MTLTKSNNSYKQFISQKAFKPLKKASELKYKNLFVI